MNPTLAGFLVWIGAAAWWALLLAYDVPIPGWAAYVAPVVVACVVLRVLVRDPT